MCMFHFCYCNLRHTASILSLSPTFSTEWFVRMSLYMHTSNFLCNSLYIFGEHHNKSKRYKSIVRGQCSIENLTKTQNNYSPDVNQIDTWQNPKRCTLAFAVCLLLRLKRMHIEWKQKWPIRQYSIDSANYWCYSGLANYKSTIIYTLDFQLGTIIDQDISYADSMFYDMNMRLSKSVYSISKAHY